MRFSASTLGFYPEDTAYPDLPKDVVVITDDRHAALLAGQATGRRIAADADGYPILVDPPAPTEEQLAASVRSERDRRLTASDWTQLPDVPADIAARWVPYRQALRDVTEQAGFPTAVVWPDPPA